MKLNAKKIEKKGFTIIELLTVMSIIVILFGLLMPAMTLVRTYSKTVKQQAQFHAIESGLQMFRDDFGEYPPSDARDRDDYGVPKTNNKDYPGAMKLAEALLGHDLLGFNPYSVFNTTGKNNNVDDPSLYDNGKTLYPTIPANTTDEKLLANMRLRKGPYVDATRTNTAAIKDLYAGQGQSSVRYVICDEFPRISVSGAGKRVGMPVLYYKANVSALMNPDPNGGTVPDDPADATYIYNYQDNYAITTTLKAPWDNTTVHPISQGTPAGMNFYDEIRNPKISSPAKPYNPDTFILISAGNDGLYGTKDDVLNFNKE